MTSIKRTADVAEMDDNGLEEGGRTSPSKRLSTRQDLALAAPSPVLRVLDEALADASLLQVKAAAELKTANARFNDLKEWRAAAVERERLKAALSEREQENARWREEKEKLQAELQALRNTHTVLQNTQSTISQAYAGALADAVTQQTKVKSLEHELAQVQAEFAQLKHGASQPLGDQIIHANVSTVTNNTALDTLVCSGVPLETLAKAPWNLAPSLLKGSDLVSGPVIQKLARRDNLKSRLAVPYFYVLREGSEEVLYARHLQTSSKSNPYSNTQMQIRSTERASDWTTVNASSLRPLHVLDQSREKGVYTDASSSHCGHLCQVIMMSMVQHWREGGVVEDEASVALLKGTKRTQLITVAIQHIARFHIPSDTE